MTTMRTIALVAISLSIIVVAGCGGGGDGAVVPDQGVSINPAMVGTWSTDAGVAQEIVDSYCLATATNRILLELRSNGTLTMQEFGEAGFLANSLGAWSMQGGVATASWSSTDDVLTCELVDGDLVLTSTIDDCVIRFWSAE